MHIDTKTGNLQKLKRGKPSEIYCGMGICYECLLIINRVPNIQACQTPVADGMIISTDFKVQS